MARTRIRRTACRHAAGAEFVVCRPGTIPANTSSVDRNRQVAVRDWRTRGRNRDAAFRAAAARAVDLLLDTP